eukprot:IDg16724t1
MPVRPQISRQLREGPSSCLKRPNSDVISPTTQQRRARAAIVEKEIAELNSMGLQNFEHSTNREQRCVVEAAVVTLLNATLKPGRLLISENVKVAVRSEASTNIDTLRTKHHDRMFSRSIGVIDEEQLRYCLGARVAVVGAGPAGLVMTRVLREAGYCATVFERGDEVGGQWNYGSSTSVMYNSLRCNLPKDCMQFRDMHLKDRDSS